MKKGVLCLFILGLSGKMNAQANNKIIAGEYYLQDVMETASGFKLNKDSTFHFFFSYGALDRSGQGKWTLKNGLVEFNSRRPPGKDFILKKEQSLANDFITIKITDDNPVLVSHVYCWLKKGDQLSEQITNDEGVVRFPKQAVDSILLMFEFCTERKSSFTISDKNNNYFEFGFEPWLMEIFFKNFLLKTNESELRGKHPLMEGANFHYKKNTKVDLIE